MKSLLVVFICIFLVCEARHLHRRRRRNPGQGNQPQILPAQEGSHNPYPWQKNAPTDGSAGSQSGGNPFANFDISAFKNKIQEKFNNPEVQNKISDFKNRFAEKQAVWAANLDEHRDEIKTEIKHAVEAFVPKELLEQWIANFNDWQNIPEADRKCLERSNTMIIGMLFSGRIKDEDEIISLMKTGCPDATATIDAWVASHEERKQAAIKYWQDTIASLPQSIQDWINALKAKIEEYKSSGAFMDMSKRPQMKTDAAELLQQWLDIKKEDLDALAAKFTHLKPFIASDGAVSAQYRVLLQAAVSWLKDGTYDKDATKAAGEALHTYFTEEVNGWKSYVQNAPEQYQLTPEQESVIDQAVDQFVDNAKNPPSFSFGGFGGSSGFKGFSGFGDSGSSSSGSDFKAQFQNFAAKFQQH